MTFVTLPGNFISSALHGLCGTVRNENPRDSNWFPNRRKISSPWSTGAGRMKPWPESHTILATSEIIPCKIPRDQCPPLGLMVLDWRLTWFCLRFSNSIITQLASEEHASTEIGMRVASKLRIRNPLSFLLTSRRWLHDAALHFSQIHAVHRSCTRKSTMRTDLGIVCIEAIESVGTRFRIVLDLNWWSLPG